MLMFENICVKCGLIKKKITQNCGWINLNNHPHSSTADQAQPP